MLSIIVALYNEKKNIGRCVESVLKQTLSDYELILIDDGSTDGSAALCDEYEKKYNRVHVIHKENGGLISARMVGINSMKGEYFTYLDADDWVDKDLYENLLNPMLENNSIDISVSPVLINTKTGEVKNRFEHHDSIVMDANTALINMYSMKNFDWSGCGKIYKKALTENLEAWWFTEPIGEDAEWNWKMFHRAKNISFISVGGYHYFENISSMSHKSIDMENLIFLDRIEHMLSEAEADEELRKTLWVLLINKCTERIFRMIIFDDDKMPEIERCRKPLLNIPKEVEPLIPEKTLKECKTYSREISELYKEKIENQVAIESCYKSLIKKGAKKIYIYGAGTIGECIAYFMDKGNMKYEGYVVSRCVHRDEKLNEKQIFSLNDILEGNRDVGLILALNKTNTAQVEQLLNNRKFFKYIDVGKYTFYY